MAPSSGVDGGSLSFDKYGTNQVVQLAGADDQDNRFSGLTVNDSKRRIWVGRTEEGTASMAFFDDQGKLVQSVEPR
jgi:hypothetical protein